MNHASLPVGLALFTATLALQAACSSGGSAGSGTTTGSTAAGGSGTTTTTSTSSGTTTSTTSTTSGTTTTTGTGGMGTGGMGTGGMGTGGMGTGGMHTDAGADAAKDAGGSLCTQTGGTEHMQLCCASQGDFPNLCTVGTCTCSPSSSHMVKACACPAGKCYDPVKGCK